MIWAWIGAATLAALGAAVSGRWIAYRSRLRKALRDLEAETGRECFSEQLLSGLPVPAQRYFRHALRPGAILASRVHLALQSCVRVRKVDAQAPYRIYRIAEVLSAGRGIWGKGWAVRRRPPRSASFWCTATDAAGREAVLDLVPVHQSSGPNQARILKTRYLFELTWLPTALLPQRGATWVGLDDARARVTVSLDGETMVLELTIGPDGRLHEVVAERWGSVGNVGGTFSHIPFGMVVDEERTFGDYTIPTVLRGGWWYRTDRYVESTRAVVEDARFY